MNKPKISVVLGSYNQDRVLQKVLEGFNQQSQNPEDFEVIVVDSSSTDGTADLLQKFKANYKLNGIIQENRGKTAARNRGVKESQSDIIMITDSDMIPHPELIKEHIEAHTQSKSPSCFEGVTLNMDRLEWPPAPQILSPYIREKLETGSKLGWWYFLTGNISFPKNLFYKFNGFDETFTGYGWEDLELGYRMYQDKIPLFYLKGAVNYHYHVISKEEEIQRNVKKGKSAQVFLKKHPNLKWFLGLNPLSVFVRKRLTKHHWLYRFAEKTLFPSKLSPLHNLGFWFLKEYHYLTGILNLSDQE